MAKPDDCTGDGKPTKPKRKVNRVIKIAVVLAVLAVAGALCAVIRVIKIAVVLAVVGALFGMPMTRMASYKEHWSADDADPVPDGFCYLLFPASPNVDVRDSNGQSVAILDRALLCDHDEWSGSRIGVWMDGTLHSVLKTQLTLTPPAREEALVANWKTAIHSWGKDTHWPEFDARLDRLAQDEYRVMVYRKGGHRARDVEDLFVYRVVGGTAMPTVWYMRTKMTGATEPFRRYPSLRDLLSEQPESLP